MRTIKQQTVHTPVSYTHLDVYKRQASKLSKLWRRDTSGRLKERRDQVRNTTIRGSLKTVPLRDDIKKAQLCWFGHVQRMEVDRLPKQLCKARIGERRLRGCRRVTWEDNVRCSMQRPCWRDLWSTSIPYGRR